MELDKRILDGKKPLTCFDKEQAHEFIGKECYFSNIAFKYEDLNDIEKSNNYVSCTKGTLSHVDFSNKDDLVFENKETTLFYRYCLPCEWVKEEKKEPKYRPYTIKDFEKAFLNDEFDDFIIFRDKDYPDDIYTMRYNGNFKTGAHEYICLGAKNFTFEHLFENYEVADYDGDWQPFGILEE